MHPILRNILAVIAGCVLGGFVNMGIIMISSYIIPPPPGADLTTAEGLLAALPMMRPEHFLMPFLAHALGTLAGSFVAAKIAVKYNLILALVVGTFFLAGGIAATEMIPAPTWFIVTDLVLAYLPMVYIGAWIAGYGPKTFYDNMPV